MSAIEIQRFRSVAAAVASFGGLLAVLAGSLLELPLLAVSFAWFATSAIGMWQGQRMVRLHGLPGAGLMMTMAFGLALRFLILLVVTALAIAGLRDLALGTLTGLIGGFVPLFIFESFWFLKRFAPAVRGSGEA